MSGYSSGAMSVDYYPMDPAFTGNNYPECGTAGFNGKGWYYFHGGQLCGPYDSKEEAEQREQTSSD